MNQWEVYEVLKKPSTAEISKLEETPSEVIKEALIEFLVVSQRGNLIVEVCKLLILRHTRCA